LTLPLWAMSKKIILFYAWQLHIRVYMCVRVYMKATEHSGVMFITPLHTWKAPRSDLGLETSYPSRHFVVFFRDSRKIAEQYIKLGTICCLPHPFQIVIDYGRWTNRETYMQSQCKTKMTMMMMMMMMMMTVSTITWLRRVTCLCYWRLNLRNEMYIFLNISNPEGTNLLVMTFENEEEQENMRRIRWEGRE
jgi:hypothetical protein